MNNQQIIERLNWRYATKAFDSSKKIDQETFDTLIEALRLAPSSYGVQPWKFVVVNDPAIREQLKAAAYGQAQVTDASDLIVLTTVDNLDEAFIDHFLQSTAEARSMKVEDLAGYKAMIMGSAAGKTQEEMAGWAARQLYLALGFLLETAAVLGVDACPMEGFDASKFNEILGLKGKGLSSWVICPVGYRLDSDTYATLPKSRFAKDEVVITI